MLGRTLWERKCAAAQGVRGEWAHSFLGIGDFAMAEKILTPPPQQCSASIAVPMVTLLRMQGEIPAAQRCIETSGVKPAQIEQEIAALLESYAQQKDKKSTDAPLQPEP